VRVVFPVPELFPSLSCVSRGSQERLHRRARVDGQPQRIKEERDSDVAIKY